MLNIDTQETMAQFTERLKEELAAEELCRQANMTDVDTIDDLVELYRPRSQGDMSDSSGRDSTSLVPLADDSVLSLGVIFSVFVDTPRLDHNSAKMASRSF